MPEGKNQGLISAGIQAGAAIAGNVSVGRQNKKSRAWSEKMYAQQTADNLAFWNQNNEYNSPQAQMERLKLAGLNPNLVYGQSSGGASGASSSPVRSPDAKTPEFKSADFSGIGTAGTVGINTYYDTEIKKATVDNLRKQNTVIVQEALLKAAQTASTGTTTQKSEVELQNLKTYSAEAARLDNQKKATEIFSTQAATDRAQELQPLKMEEAVTDILAKRVSNERDRQAIKNAIKDGDLKQLEINLLKAGISKSDPMYMRIMMQNKDLILKMYNNKN